MPFTASIVIAGIKQKQVGLQVGAYDKTILDNALKSLTYVCVAHRHSWNH